MSDAEILIICLLSTFGMVALIGMLVGTKTPSIDEFDPRKIRSEYNDE